MGATTAADGDRLVILGTVWQPEGPMIRVRRAEAAESVLEPLTGFRLGYRTGPESRRRCVGHTAMGTGGRRRYVDCPQRPQEGGRTCRACAVVEASFAANLHHAHTRAADLGTPDPDLAAHLRQPNLVYLAAFRDGSVKIGTSTESRRDTRLSEQGAWRARIVARAPNGVVVRWFEDYVTKRLGLPQSVSATRKLDGLARPLDDERLDEALTAETRRVHTLLAEDTASEGGGDTAEDPAGGGAEAGDDDTGAPAGSGGTGMRPLDDAWRHPRADAETWRRVHRYPADLAVGAHDLAVVDVCGRLVALQRPGSDDTFVADLQRLYGLELELGDFGSEPLAVQDSLF